MSIVQSMEQSVDPAARAFFCHVEKLLGSLLTRVLRCAVSPALRDDGDLACALCDARGVSVIERGGNPVLVGALSAQVRALLAHVGSIDRLPADVVLFGNAESPRPEHASSLESPITDAALPAGFVDRQTFTLLVPLLPGQGTESAGGTDAPGPATGDEPIADQKGARAGWVLALCARFAGAPFGAPLPGTGGLDVDALPSIAADELSALPPAVGPRYLPFAPSPPAAPPRLRDQEGAAIAPSAVDERQLQSLLRTAAVPRDTQSDLLALRASLLHARRALQSLLSRVGWSQSQALCQSLQAQTAATVRQWLQGLPGGFYAFADSLDEDGCGSTDIALRATLLLRRDGWLLDLCDSADACAGPLNLSTAATVGVVKEAIARLVGSLSATAASAASDATGTWLARNDGLLAGLQLRLRSGSVLAAQAPLAQALAVDETAARLLDVLQGVFAQAAAQAVGSAGAGTRSALYVEDPNPTSLAQAGRSAAVQRILLPGGVGATPQPAAFTGGLHEPRLPSLDRLETSLPVRVQVLARRPESAGLGLRAGTLGWHRELCFLRPQLVTLAGDRRRRPPYGLSGGGPGSTGHDVLYRGEGEQLQGKKLPAKAVICVQAGDRIDTDSPGGAGHGDAQRAVFFASLFGDNG